MGKYIVIDGVDGAGKSTQTALLADRLASDGIAADLIAEPGGTPMGSELRRLILSPDIELLPETEFDLFNAARRELAHRLIRPALRGGVSLISDRNWSSSVAMQGFGRGLNVEDIITQSERALGDCFIPDALVIVDLPVEVALDRVRDRGRTLDWFEQEGRDFFQKARIGYKWVAENFDGLLIDGSADVETVHTEIYEKLGALSIF
jgi:dTMP kinase